MMDGAFEDPNTLGQVSYMPPADIGFKMPAQLQRRPLPAISQPDLMAPFMRWIDAAKRGYATGKSLSGELAPGAGGEPTGPAPRLASADPNPTSSDVGVGGPSRSRSIPINGPSVAADMGTPGFSDGFGDDPRLADAGAFGAPTQAAAVAPADSEDLGDRYRKRVAGIPAPKGDLTDDQKNKLQLDFFLHLLANNKPGSRFLQNAGEAGVTTSAGYQAQTDKNLARSTQQQQFARDEVFKEMGLSDKSQDNKELARHHKALEKLQSDQNDVTKAYREGQISAKEAELEVRKIQAQMAELRASVNPLKGQVEYLRTLLPNADPKDLVHMVLTKDRSGKTDQELADQAWVRATGANTGMPVPSTEAMLARKKYGETISRSHPDYRETLGAMGGDTKANREKLDNVLKTSRGLRVVD